jgi:homoserine acetyltransferase
MKVLWIAAMLAVAVPASPARAQPSAARTVAPVEADYVARDFKFQAGDTLPALTLHYRTLGTPQRDASGVVRNAVLILHGTGGTGEGFLSRTFGGELFGPGQLLDSCSTRPATSSFFPTGSATGSRASRATVCTRAFRSTPTMTWFARSTFCSPTA